MARSIPRTAVSFDLEHPSAQDPPWLEPVRAALARAPMPQEAVRHAQRVLEGCSDDELGPRATREPEQLAHVLLALCGIAPFMATHLARHPDWLVALIDDELAVPRAHDVIATAVATALRASDDPVRALREVKYRELARITVRECGPWVPLERVGEVLRELSTLADALLQGALGIAAKQMREQYGPPRWLCDGVDEELGFTVLALGKHGAEELNYSSDVDLVYVHRAPSADPQTGEPPEHARIAPAEYFTRLAQRFGRLVTDTTPEGFLYRIDVELRPEGAQGALVVSEEALAVYYESKAAGWERAAFMKARAVAGDLTLGRDAIDTVAPTIYRSAMDYAGVDAIRALKERITSERGGRAEGFDIKLDAGGIRDVEFVAQALQLLHGGRIPEVRARGTEEALERIGEARLLPAERVAKLLAAYRFLRRLEHRVQMIGERQTHLLPNDPGERTRIAGACDFADADDPLAALDATLATHRTEIDAVFGAFFARGGAERIFDLLARRVPDLAAVEPARGMLLDLATAFAHEIDGGSDPERALQNLDRFVEGVGGRRFYFELLLDRPELVPRLCRLFAASNYLSDILARHPRLIEPLFDDPSVLLLDHGQLTEDLAALVADCRRHYDDEDEATLAALRFFSHRQTVNIGLIDVGGAAERASIEGGLTDLAQVCIERALAASHAWLTERRAQDAAAFAHSRFAVIGMGKLASSEMSYGSDLDLVFVFDWDGDDDDALLMAQEPATRLAQRLISLLSTRTSDGSCYEIDARLRPSGNQGSLVASLRGITRYHAEEAALWERQALLRARPAAGDRRLGEDFEALRRRVLAKPLAPDAPAQVHHIRMRMEHELGKETAAKRDVKLGRGGLLDVETVVQYLQLAHGRTHPELHEVTRTEVQLQRLANLGLLEPSAAADLTHGWDFLQRLSSRLRLVDNRSISDLDAERGDLDAIARRLGYTTSGHEGAAKRALLADYHHHTDAIRNVYRSLFAD